MSPGEGQNKDAISVMHRGPYAMRTRRCTHEACLRQGQFDCGAATKTPPKKSMLQKRLSPHMFRALAVIAAAGESSINAQAQCTIYMEQTSRSSTATAFLAPGAANSQAPRTMRFIRRWVSRFYAFALTRLKTGQMKRSTLRPPMLPGRSVGNTMDAAGRRLSQWRASPEFG